MTKTTFTQTSLSENEVCIALEVTRATLGRWEKLGILLPFRIGRRKRYNIEDIQEILTRGTKPLK